MFEKKKINEREAKDGPLKTFSQDWGVLKVAFVLAERSRKNDIYFIRLIIEKSCFLSNCVVL